MAMAMLSWASLLFNLLVLQVLLPHNAAAFLPASNCKSSNNLLLALFTTAEKESQTDTGSYAPRTGVAQTLLNFALASPLWEYVLVPQARNKMVTTAEANGIEWRQKREWIQAKQQQQQQQLQSTVDLEPLDDGTSNYPDYYSQAPFHAYKQGNLCWDAAFEQEIASRAVGARNFPQFGQDGDVAFRQAFAKGLEAAGATLPSASQQSGPVVAVDMGCGTGLSSRQLATTDFVTTTTDIKNSEETRQVDQVIGLDLSPYYIEVGKTLLDLDDANNWVNPIEPRAKDIVQLSVANAEDTGIESNSIDIVQIMFVLHELPAENAASVIREAHRIVKSGTGQVWMGEMDFQAPAYAKQRANALLFSLIRATEPYLDDYADGFVTHIKATLEELFETVTWTAATGRHYAMVATKGATTDPDSCLVTDKRFLPNGEYAIEDTHLQLWDNKQDDNSSN